MKNDNDFPSLSFAIVFLVAMSLFFYYVLGISFYEQMLFSIGGILFFIIAIIIMLLISYPFAYVYYKFLNEKYQKVFIAVVNIVGTIVGLVFIILLLKA